MYNQILGKVEKYYTDKVLTYGTNHKGVDWNSRESQEIRYEQLLKVCNEKEKFTILDYGCGYGYLFEYMKNRNYNFEYYGFDISEEMINKARQTYKENNCYFSNSTKMKSKTDYCVASGIFNVKFDTDFETWTEYILSVLNEINNNTTKGFSFNCLTKYSDKEYMKDNLYYGDPCYFFDYCKKQFSKNVAILHDYDLYEFTIVVKK